MSLAALASVVECIQPVPMFQIASVTASVNWHMTRLCNYSCKFCRTIDRVTDSVNSVFAYGQSGTSKSIIIVSLMSTPSYCADSVTRLFSESFRLLL